MTNCCQEELSIKIKFKDPKVYEDFNHIEVGDWIDLRVNDTVSLKAGQFKLLDLGVALELPKGYEAYILPRSSTFKKYGLIQTNGVSAIDNSYNGDEDWWLYPVKADRDITLLKGTRICQFRIQKNQPKIKFEIVDKLENSNRGGVGSTGER